MPIMWTDTKKSDMLSGLRVPDSWLATEKPDFLIGLRVPISWRTTEKSVIKGGCHLLRQANPPFKYSKETIFKGILLMTTKQALRIITQCAKQYHQYLENNQVAFVYRDQNNHSSFTVVQFHSHNFLHFTGVSVKPGMTANHFYRAALNNRLSENDFSFKHSRTTEQKLKVLHIIMNIDTKARMIGNYTGPHIELYTEKVTGTTNACLGLIQRKRYYIPNSILNEDIRSITPKPQTKSMLYSKNPSKLFAPSMLML